MTATQLPVPICIGLDVLLPGPDRKRTVAPYHFHLRYRRPEQDARGCLMTWDVVGGRMPYQLALERQEKGDLRIHCTCADAVYRGEQPGHRCKHVEGFLQAGLQLPATTISWRQSA
jgi:hypothetical protein